LTSSCRRDNNLFIPSSSASLFFDFYPTKLYSIGNLITSFHTKKVYERWKRIQIERRIWGKCEDNHRTLLDHRSIAEFNLYLTHTRSHTFILFAFSLATYPTPGDLWFVHRKRVSIPCLLLFSLSLVTHRHFSLRFSVLSFLSTSSW